MGRTASFHVPLLYFADLFGRITNILGVNVISIWEDIRGGFDFTYLLGILLGVIPSLLCITLHELSHGYVAYKLGDTTAKDAGRLTLNPLKHLDPMGLLMMVVFHVGWAKPVPVNPNNYRHGRRDDLLVSAAAGSGKTYTLVERIVQNIIAGKYRIDELLVVTFTNAAAAEMRERIEKKLTDELENHPFGAVDPEEEDTVMCGVSGHRFSYRLYA